jgi:cholesterol oxidase
MAEDTFDAVVIGSGFGGSVVAHRLASEGRSVLVLERGQPYPPGSFPRTPNELRRALWDPSDGKFGLVDLWSFDHLDAVVASGLGGGSLIYANVMLRKPERTFVREDLQDGGYEYWPVTLADLEPHYDAVERMQQPERFPLGRGEPYKSTHKTLAMLEGGNRLKLPTTTPPLAVRFAPEDGDRPAPGVPFSDGGDNLHGAPRSTCRLCGECDFGCNYGAKNTLDFTYLTAAAGAGAVIRTCCEARTLTRLDGRAPRFRIGYRQHLSARAGHPAHLVDPSEEPFCTVIAKDVVLAAGAVATPFLLLANRGELPGLSRALGTRVSGNGDYLAFVRDCRVPAQAGGGWRYLDPSRGPVITASIEVSEEESAAGRGFLIQDAGAPYFTEWLWQMTELPGNLVRTFRPWLGGMVARWRGRRQTQVSALAADLLGDAHSSAAMMPLLGMGRDVPNGRYRLEGKLLELDWSGKLSDAYYDAMRERMGELASALGGQLVRSPLDLSRRSISVHMVGGCPMALDAHDGVVDPWGRVYGQPGLWIADGSVIPGPVGVNPSFTVAALADRFADALLGLDGGRP